MKGDFKQAKDISLETKKKVLERQKNRSITGVYIRLDNATFHHFVSRGCSGIGYEWNICALTFDEHRAYHDGNAIKINNRDRYTNKEFETLMRNHLIINYDGWTEKKCKYKKGYEESDYEITRRKLK